MADFFGDVLKFTFLQNAVLGGLLAAVGSSVVGSFVTVRRISYIAGAISHACLGGMGLARYLSRTFDWQWLTPLVGALVFALLSAWLVGFVASRGKEREDSVLSALWSVGMALGIVFIFITPGYKDDLMSYLIGNILLIGSGDLYLLLALDAAILAVVALFYNKFLSLCFDEEFSRLRGVPTATFNYILLTMIALTVVVLSQVVGLIMVIALLTLPAATAGIFTRKLSRLMWGAGLLSAVCILGGLWLSYGPDLPSGAVIILLSGGLYLLALLGRSGLRRWKAGRARLSA